MKCVSAAPPPPHTPTHNRRTCPGPGGTPGGTREWLGQEHDPTNEGCGRGVPPSRPNALTVQRPWGSGGQAVQNSEHSAEGPGGSGSFETRNTRTTVGAAAEDGVFRGPAPDTPGRRRRVRGVGGRPPGPPVRHTAAPRGASRASNEAGLRGDNGGGGGRGQEPRGMGRGSVSEGAGAAPAIGRPKGGGR